MGTLIAPPRSESQIPPLLLDIGLDLGKKLFDMGIEYAKGTVLETVFKQPTISDVHQWVDRSVTSIEAKIAALDAKIDRLNLDKMASDLQSVKNEFEHYARMPLNQKQQNRYLLEYCDTKSNELLPQTQKYDQAFFLSSTVLAYMMLTSFALYQHDSSAGPGAEAHVASLVSTVESYFASAAGSRARLVDKLAPHYTIRCNDVEKEGFFTSPKTACSILRGEAVVAKLQATTWPSNSQRYGAQGYTLIEERSAVKYLNRMLVLKSDWGHWRNVNRKSGEQIESAAECMNWMYWVACKKTCPAQLDKKWLDLSNTSSLQYTWEGDAKLEKLVRFNP